MAEGVHTTNQSRTFWVVVGRAHVSHRSSYQVSVGHTMYAALQLPPMLLLTRYAALLLLIANLPQNLQQELRTGGAAVVARKARRI